MENLNLDNLKNENAKASRGTPFGPPPDFTPKKTPDLYKNEPLAIRSCKGKYTYLWLKNGKSHWIYITNAGRSTVSGYKWNKFGWTFFGISLSNVESFLCV